MGSREALPRRMDREMGRFLTINAGKPAMTCQKEPQEKKKKKNLTSRSGTGPDRGPTGLRPALMQTSLPQTQDPNVGLEASQT